MLPAAIGTQVGGSIIRPAAFCGNVALKPTQGGINRGERQATSMSTHGVHAGCIEDMWHVAIEIAERAGGDRGCLGLFGPRHAPAARKPERLIVLETAGWVELDAGSKSAFEALLEHCEGCWHPVAAAHRQSLWSKNSSARSPMPGPSATPSPAWENRWYQRNLVNENPAGVSERAKATLARAEAMTVADYRAALIDRETAQACYSAVAPLADAIDHALQPRARAALARRPAGQAARAAPDR